MISYTYNFYRSLWQNTVIMSTKRKALAPIQEEAFLSPFSETLSLSRNPFPHFATFPFYFCIPITM